jgi:undecaprenyl diphosphate synthase
MAQPAPEASGNEPRAAGPSGIRHVAVVMDGNGRWARKRFMPRGVASPS